MPEPDTSPATETSAPPAPLGPRARWFPFAVAAALVAGAAALAYSAFLSSRETTDDAFLDGNIVAIAPSVAGRVIRVAVHDNQLVRRNDPLLEIDPSTYQANLALRTAAHADAVSSVAAAQAQLANARAHLAVLRAAWDQAKADADAAQAEAVRTAADFKRDQNLLETGAITQQQHDRGQADAEVARANVEAAREHIAGAEAQVAEAQTNVQLAEANVEAARAAAAQAAAAEKSAAIDLADTRLAAPEDGRVTRKSVDVGDYAEVGESLLAIVPSKLWVTANFKETQLARMRAGQPVEIKIDADPGRKYRAHVDSIQAGSGSRFSLFPPENATGNYVKIVQRVPVKIVFDQPLDPKLAVGPGESVEPVVHVGSTRLDPVTVVLLVLVDALLIAGLARLSRRPAAD